MKCLSAGEVSIDIQWNQMTKINEIELRNFDIFERLLFTLNFFENSEFIREFSCLEATFYLLL